VPGFYEPDAGQALDASAIVVGCIESGVRAVLLDDRVAPAELFDLSTRVAGELLHGLSKYEIRLAVVVPDPTSHSGPFQDFAREANRGSRYRFFPTREEAITWLDTG
jgi:hypothetical protein